MIIAVFSMDNRINVNTFNEEESEINVKGKTYYCDLDSDDDDMINLYNQIKKDHDSDVDAIRKKLESSCTTSIPDHIALPIRIDNNRRNSTNNTAVVPTIVYYNNADNGRGSRFIIGCVIVVGFFYCFVKSITDNRMSPVNHAGY